MSIKTNNPVMKTDRTAKADASYLNGDYGGFAEVLSSERRCNFVFCRRGHPLLSLRFRVPFASASPSLPRPLRFRVPFASASPSLREGDVGSLERRWFRKADLYT